MFMKRFAPQVYALMRIVTGFLFLWHGTQKLFGFPVPVQGLPGYIVAIAGPIETIGGALVMAGLFTRWAAFLCSGLMAAAYWMMHAPQALFPIQNRGDLAILYCFVFLYISAQGPGLWSIDSLIRARGGFRAGLFPAGIVTSSRNDPFPACRLAARAVYFLHGQTE